MDIIDNLATTIAGIVAEETADDIVAEEVADDVANAIDDSITIDHIEHWLSRLVAEGDLSERQEIQERVSRAMWAIRLEGWA